MIGGVDKPLRTTGGACALDFCIRMICHQWPHAVFEDVMSERPLSNYCDLSFSSLSEVFVYRDANAAEVWHLHGADDSNLNTMIHLMLSPTEITIVIDDSQDAAMKRILNAMRAGLERDLLLKRSAA